MRFFQNADYDFISRRRIAYVASAVALVIALVAGIFWQVTRGSWVNYGVDFTGGTLVQVAFDEGTTSITHLRDVFQPEFPGSEVTVFGDPTEFLIRAPAFSEGGVNVSDQIQNLMGANFAEGEYEVVRVEAVGPKVGEELQARAAFAILLSFALTLIYLAFRFEWRFGVAAIIATVHDILITLGFLSVFQVEVSLPTVAAVLTIIGYSLNDTIVIFDRVRENLKKMGRRLDYHTILTRSINETLPRTVMTSGTTLVALFALLVLGGAIIRDFAMILILGIVIGTYSSIFVASPALLEIQQRWGRGDRPAKRRREAKAAAGA